MLRRRTLGRRSFLGLAAAAAGAVGLASCAPTAPPSPTAKSAEAVKATVPPAPTAPSQPPATAVPQAKAPAPTAPASPQATKPAAPATAAPSPAVSTPSAPAATAAPEAKIGKQLIGKLEGPEVITDAAKYPKTFKEAPMLADLVKAGKLPPVQERIGQDPLVIKPVREIGKFGGQWRRGFAGPSDTWNGTMELGHDYLTYWDYAITKLTPNVVRSWEMSPDGRTTTLLLRRGMKWSDGHPFIADDFVFWFEDMYQNKDLVPTPAFLMTINTKPITVEKVDDYTVRFKAPDPYYLLPSVLAGHGSLNGPANAGVNALGGYAPAHYLKQFHPKYVGQEELDKKVKELKFDGWVNLFKARNTWALNADLPTVTAWKTSSPINTPNWVLERNPYSIWVDTEGNQLPYIDRVTMMLGENLEIINLRAIAGEYDNQARHIDVGKLPVLLENQQKGGYKVYLDPAERGSDVAFKVNQSFEAEPEIAKWITNSDFRRALSLGIDRDQLNETFWLGLGTPGSTAPGESTIYSPGPEYRKLWSTYDPKKANEMLDKLGLDKKDAEGYRLRTDGKGRLRIEVATIGGQFMPYTQICEMIREQYRKIGFQIDVVEMERGLQWKRRDANELPILVDATFGSENLFGHASGPPFPADGTNNLGPLIGRWFASAGKQGKQPPPRMKEAMDLFRKAFGIPDEERIRLGKEVWKIALDEVWTVATVGLSPASLGVRVTKNNMGNVPERIISGSAHNPPGPVRPESYYFK